MNARATIPALLSFLCGLALAVPAGACPAQQQNAENSSPVVLAGDMETEAVEQDLRPDIYGDGSDASEKASTHEGHEQQHESGGDTEHEMLEKEIEPGSVPDGE